MNGYIIFQLIILSIMIRTTYALELVFLTFIAASNIIAYIQKRFTTDRTESGSAKSF